jgi:hypothetical protein
MAPKQCPSCNRTTFVHFKEEEGPNLVCEELLFVAALVRMGFDQSQLNRSALSKIPTGAAKKGKAARASTGASSRKYRIA